MSSGTAIHIEHLRVQLGKAVILPDVSIEIPEGEIIGLLGPSGAGKTTLVKAIMGMNESSGGSITVFGRRIPSIAAISGIGYMAQSDALYEDLSAMDNILFFGSLFKVRGAQATERASRLLNFVGLGSDAGKAVRDFSSGMKRRLSLAIALMHSPKLLILDEPTVGIDPLLRKRFWDKFAELKGEGCTILVTTHVMDEARHCDKILLMRDGALIANGTPAEILAATGTQNMEDAFLFYCGDVKEAM
ncbi:MAG: ABC transporter ATP-binding protein [Clostridia bacterium]|nr:ABC transporter ATP-binding protein [Clostridia bacterium]